MSTPIMAQPYITAVGVRFGEQTGITLRQQLCKSHTADMMLHSDFSEELVATALLQRHRKLLGRRVNYFYGVGAHKGWRIGETQSRDFWGISGIVGAEIIVGRWNVSADLKPALHVQGYQRLPLALHTGISIRHVLIPQRKQSSQGSGIWKHKHPSPSAAHPRWQFWRKAA